MDGVKKMYVIAAIFAFALCAAFSSGAWADPGQWPKTVRLGLIPTEGGADIVKRFQPLIEHLEKTLGVKVEAKSASDYAGVITAMAHKHIDFAYLGPKSYTEASEKANAQAVACEKNKKGEPGYYGIIIGRTGSGIKTLEDARGHVFAFTDPNSTSGYLVPNVLFYRDLKVDPRQYFKEVKFSGSHGASILAVKNGSIEVAATNNIDLDRMAEKGQASWDDFNILWKSDLIPGSPMCVRSDLPESLKAAFAGALMMFNSNQQGLEKLQIGGYQPADDTTYDVIRYLKQLKKQLAQAS
ncbi:phosphonate transport system substrate-binding protein [Desulfacinum hydrothermale DSM 13146]|uniref:Phosphonate transport system substrate-binding protein n=1 Tax=Desulfacinum hydrothermale DSM 13146 TaxID=1121390 RepID=A0A1W1XJA5_9BACT|nr:phosphonate ABC transporter substrate-binding protein [Desulfacinum hydrothermale]SMC23611.1 phosphonate transport system substrate-binding protein [Desulfacinum hydrothermale DSM 13146]